MSEGKRWWSLSNYVDLRVPDKDLEKKKNQHLSMVLHIYHNILKYILKCI